MILNSFLLYITNCSTFIYGILKIRVLSYEYIIMSGGNSFLKRFFLYVIYPFFSGFNKELYQFSIKSKFDLQSNSRYVIR